MTAKPCVVCDGGLKWLCPACMKAVRRDRVCPACFAAMERRVGARGRVTYWHGLPALCVVGALAPWFQKGRAWPTIEAASPLGGL